MSIKKFCCIAFLLAIVVSSSSASVPRAIANAQAGLSEALMFQMPAARKFKRIEYRRDGILVYKVTIKRLSKHSFKIRVTGFDEGDEVVIVTSTPSN